MFSHPPRGRMSTKNRPIGFVRRRAVWLMSLSKIHNRWSFLTLGIFGIITQSKRISIQIPRPPSHSPSVRPSYSPRYTAYLHSLSFSPRLNQSNYTVEREVTVQLSLCLSRPKKTIANTQSLRRPWRLIIFSASVVSIHTPVRSIAVLGTNTVCPQNRRSLFCDLFGLCKLV